MENKRRRNIKTHTRTHTHTQFGVRDDVVVVVGVVTMRALNCTGATRGGTCRRRTRRGSTRRSGSCTSLRRPASASGSRGCSTSNCSRPSPCSSCCSSGRASPTRPSCGPSNRSTSKLSQPIRAGLSNFVSSTPGQVTVSCSFLQSHLEVVGSI